ncbi:hypothetical protein Q8F55_006141 [Vanrija albida]|uniref:Major facilitator superfamily (MFS) profile domain-containing protein n=1 Tax=Vanrija albida TaxID=181172 RepID=A0ABR3PW93_9TREE
MDPEEDYELQPLLAHDDMSTQIPELVDTSGYASPKVRRPGHDDDSASYKDEESDGKTSQERSRQDQATDSDTVSLTQFYEPPDSYESKHRWDPKATWSKEEEKKLVRKLDFRVAFVACICFAALQLDRGNLSNAVSDNLLKDIGLTTQHYNYGNTIFYACFLAAELPSQMISKKLGSDVWIPIQMMAWSAVAMGQCGLNGKTSFYVTRALLGLLEGGFIADTILYLSYYYTHAELTIRLSYFWVSLTVTGIIGSFLAAGILEMRHHTHWPGWRWLFLIEGILTFLVGFWAALYLPPGPCQTGKTILSRIFGTKWFTDREEVIIVNRVLRDDPTKSSMHNRQGLNLEDLARSLSDYDMWPLYILGLITFVAPGTVGQYFTLTLKSLGYSTFQTNLLTIPSQVLYLINNLALAYLSRLLNERLLTASITMWWLLILFIALVELSDDASRWARWAVISLVQAYPYNHPILVSMNSSNAGSVRTRTVASAVYNMTVQAGHFISSNIYQPHDAPFYHHGNKVLLGFIAADIVLFWLAKAWYIWRNKSRDKIWNAWTEEEKAHYLATTKDQGNKRLDFRFLH